MRIPAGVSPTILLPISAWIVQKSSRDGIRAYS
jgi:hypothetical protein